MTITFRLKRFLLRRGPFRVRNIEDQSRRPDHFNEILKTICESGTDSLETFGSHYTREGGLCLQQNPHELASLITLLRERSPILHYMEIGSASGGTCCLLSDLVGFNTVLSMDDGRHPRAGNQKLNFCNIGNFTQWIGDSHSDDAKQFLSNYANNAFDVAFIDGDHSETGVKQDIALVLPFLKKGGWIILHDTVPCEGVQRAWLELAYSRRFRPIAEFIGKENPMGIAVAERL